MVAWWAWAAVIAFIIGMLLVDLLVFHRDEHEVVDPGGRGVEHRLGHDQPAVRRRGLG